MLNNDLPIPDFPITLSDMVEVFVILLMGKEKNQDNCLKLIDQTSKTLQSFSEDFEVLARIGVVDSIVVGTC